MNFIHTKTFKITEKHLDQNEHVNNVQYVHWVEEAAAEHWNILKQKTQYRHDYWVLVDHHIQYKKQVFLGEEMTVKTYPEQPEGIKQPRKFEFYVNNGLVVDSRTLWVLMNGNSQKIIRLNANWLSEIDDTWQ